jgi:hypothetical protein
MYMMRRCEIIMNTAFTTPALRHTCIQERGSQSKCRPLSARPIANSSLVYIIFIICIVSYLT